MEPSEHSSTAINHKTKGAAMCYAPPPPSPGSFRPISIPRIGASFTRSYIEPAPLKSYKYHIPTSTPDNKYAELEKKLFWEDYNRLMRKLNS